MDLEYSPNKKLDSSVTENAWFKIGSARARGWRINMEDSAAMVLSINNDEKSAYFGVFDGHGGKIISNYAGNHLHHKILKHPSFDTDVKEAIISSFLEIDKEMKTLTQDRVGSTALCVIIKDGKIYCGNAGDCKAVGSVNGKLLTLSIDHRPTDPKEMKRIYAAGGFVRCERTNDDLKMSRAFGDYEYKNEALPPEKQIVSAYPDVITSDVTDDLEFLVIATDGIWDRMSDMQVIDIVREAISNNISLEIICEDLMKKCITDNYEAACRRRGDDNIAVYIVCFLNGRSYENLVQRCKMRNQ